MDCSDWSNLDDDVLIWKNQKPDRYASCVMQKGYVIFDAREEAVVVSQIHLTQECNLWGANPQKWWRRGMKSCVNKSYICYMHLGYVMLFSCFLHLQKKKKKMYVIIQFGLIRRSKCKLRLNTLQINEM